MDPSELAGRMLQWRKLRLQLDGLEKIISAGIMAMPEPASQTVGDVKAKYEAGDKKYNWEQAAADHKAAGNEIDPKIIEDCTSDSTDWMQVAESAMVGWNDKDRQVLIMKHTQHTVNWTAACKAAKIKDAPVVSQAPAKVTVSLIKPK